MRRAEYPQRMCKEPVWSIQAYPCEIVDQHPGPCASFSVAISVTLRDQWEAANQDWERQVGSMDIIVQAPTPETERKGQ